MTLRSRGRYVRRLLLSSLEIWSWLLEAGKLSACSWSPKLLCCRLNRTLLTSCTSLVMEVVLVRSSLRWRFILKIIFVNKLTFFYLL
ncbi:GSCOCG00008958001-RA-CDS [Cotesia congregata]|nr:GSCOCG00008958001-RA-CDS [Cotesia congregata]